jgi:hypothetical protein
MKKVSPPALSESPLDLFGVQVEALKLCKETLKKLKTVLGSANLKKIKVENSKDIYNLVNAQSGVIRSIESLERASRDRELLLNQVGELLKNDVRIMLKEKPELIQQVWDVIDKAKEKNLLSS